jgi:two-component system nitrogen regulation response regulator NtrX
MPGDDGLEVLKKLKGLYPDVEVIMMSGHGTVETAVRAIKRGAFDFLEKPLHAESRFAAFGACLFVAKAPPRKPKFKGSLA